jgi:hypothetical protein
MLPLDSGDLGIYEDALPVAAPNQELSAVNVNRAFENIVQMTRTSMKALVRWTAHTGGTTKTYTDSEIVIRTQWGSGDAQKPTIEKTADGLYTITFAAAFADFLGFASHDETVSFIDGDFSWRTGDATDLPGNNATQILTRVANVVTVAAYSGGSLGDAGDVSGVPYEFTLKLWS